ncbi:ATP-grasp domain-containing protein [Metabacillus litoralis]|uniref:ATP-grasp domain-containing protein n=1 Tax=Metabacillus litoralis TaxID=152268 RepID=UPI000EF5A96A|nr:ATP-grasp domain-containing protein [Metabacillus litoralis]MCM3161367.1 ATP-grasp domain-containing protein [Metabacillus litoralis]
MNTRKRVLVTGARAPVALHLCRLMSQAGFEVYATDCISYPLTKVSNSIKKFIFTPSPKKDTKSFIKSLINIIEQQKISLIIPTSEEIFYISRYKDQLTPFCHVFVDDFAKLNLLHNKYEFIQLVKNLGFEVPRTALLSNHVNLDQFEDESALLKKVYSRFSESIIFLQSVGQIPNHIKKGGSWLVQEKIVGKQYCSYTIANDGKVLAHSTYKSEFTAGLGATLSFKHESRPDIERFAQVVVEKLNFSGQISFDFIIHENGVAFPIECNPRATSGLHLFDKKLAYLFTDAKSILYPRKDKKEAIKLAVFLYGWKQVKSLRQLRRLLEVFFSYKDITFTSNDLGPYFYQLISLYKMWKESRRNKVSLMEQSTIDISWDGETI